MRVRRNAVGAACQRVHEGAQRIGRGSIGVAAHGKDGLRIGRVRIEIADHGIGGAAVRSVACQRIGDLQRVIALKQQRLAPLRVRHQLRRAACGDRACGDRGRVGEAVDVRQQRDAVVAVHGWREDRWLIAHIDRIRQALAGEATSAPAA